MRIETTSMDQASGDDSDTSPAVEVEVTRVPDSNNLPTLVEVEGMSVTLAPEEVVETREEAEQKLEATMHNQISNAVRNWWATGGLLLQAEAMPDTPSFSKFCQEFIGNRNNGETYSKAALYHARNFRLLFKAEDIETMIECRMSWRNILCLLNKDLTPRRRQEALEAVASGQIQQTKLKEYLSDCDLAESQAEEAEDLESPAPDEEPLPRGFKRNIEDVRSFCLSARAKVDKAKGLMDTLDGLNEDQQARVNDDLASLDEALKPLARELAELNHSLEAVLNVG